MNQRRLVAAELAKFFGALSNPLRVQIIEELGDQELTVNELQNALAVPHALVSQHLGVLRANKLVVERRQGKNVFYHLRQAELANVIRQCLIFVSPDKLESERILDAIHYVSNKWSEPTAKPLQIAKAPRRQKGSSG